MFTLPASIRRGARLDVVAHAIADASGKTRYVYVERRGSLFRWSVGHRGGPYPLLRETCKVLGIDHHGLVMPWRGLPTGLAIVDTDDWGGAPPDGWAVLEFEAAETVQDVRARMRESGLLARLS